MEKDSPRLVRRDKNKKKQRSKQALCNCIKTSNDGTKKDKPEVQTGDKIGQAELLRGISSSIEPLYGEQEALSVSRILLKGLYGVDRLSLALEPRRELEVTDRLRVAVEELIKGRPIQYILGEAPFCGLDFVVREGALIPRPETEELVEWVVQSVSSGARILDIGTGSGAIAIVLALRVEESVVSGVDISKEALEVAALNAQRLGAAVELIEVDVLTERESWAGKWGDEEWDVVVSNPPYIPSSEREQMHRNVTEYEPKEALFVDDADPLIFYREIAIHSLELLRGGGLLFFEIHEEYADDLVALLEQMGYLEVELMLDINGKKRAVRCRKKES